MLNFMFRTITYEVSNYQKNVHQIILAVVFRGLIMLFNDYRMQWLRDENQLKVTYGFKLLNLYILIMHCHI